MPRFNKWLAEIEPDDPVQRVGRAAIRLRLEAVLHYLRAAGEEGDREDAIHQLRIWTRRAAAALRLFEPIVPQPAGKKMNRRLRKIRSAAGEERDCDVLLERLKHGESDPPRKMLQALRQRRRQARQEFNALRKRRLRRDKLQRQCDRLTIKLTWPKRHSSRESPPFAAWCQAQLAPLGEQFFAHADGALSQADQLHELRIAGKRLRYALELSPVALPARAHQRLYDALTDVQERLGTICDHLSAAARLKEWLTETKSSPVQHALRSQIRREQKQLAAGCRRFLRWWSIARRRRLRADWNAALNTA